MKNVKKQSLGFKWRLLMNATIFTAMISIFVASFTIAIISLPQKTFAF